jgi:hypothetical protein
VDTRRPSIDSKRNHDTIAFGRSPNVLSIRNEVKRKLDAAISKFSIHWRAVLKRCKGLDPTGSTLVKMDSLLKILSDHGVLHLSTRKVDWL